MSVVCTVSKTICDDNANECKVCGFSDLHRIFINEDEGDYWLETVVKPYRQQWEFDKREAELLAQLEESRKKVEELSLSTSNADSYPTGKSLSVVEDMARAIIAHSNRSICDGMNSVEWAKGLTSAYGFAVDYTELQIHLPTTRQHRRLTEVIKMLQSEAASGSNAHEKTSHFSLRLPKLSGSDMN